MVNLWLVSDDVSRGTKGALVWNGTGPAIVVLYATPIAAILGVLAQEGVAHPRDLSNGFKLLEIKVPAGSAAVPVEWRDGEHELLAWITGLNASGVQFPLLLEMHNRDGAVQTLLNVAHAELEQCRVRSQSAFPFRRHLSALDEGLQLGADWLAIPGREEQQ